MAGLSTGAKTLLAASVLSAVTVYYIHWSEKEARQVCTLGTMLSRYASVLISFAGASQRMKAGPLRDRVTYEEKAKLFQKSSDGDDAQPKGA